MALLKVSLPLRMLPGMMDPARMGLSLSLSLSLSLDVTCFSPLGTNYPKGADPHVPDRAAREAAFEVHSNALLSES